MDCSGNQPNQVASPLLLQRRPFSTVLLVCLAFLVMSSIAAGIYAAWRLNVKLEKEQSFYHVISQADIALQALLDAETAQRGYLLTGQATYLNPYQGAAQRFERAIEQVAVLESARQSRIVANGYAILSELNSTIDLAKSGELDAALRRVKSDEGRKLMEAVRADVAILRQKLLATLAATQELRTRMMLLAELAGLVGMAAALGLIGLLMYSCRLLDKASRGIADEITQRRSMEAALRRLNAKLDRALRRTNSRILTLDAQRRYTWVHNPHNEHDAESVIGRTDEEIVHYPDQEVLIKAQKKALAENRVVRLDLRYPSQAGLEYYDITIEPWLDGDDALLMSCVNVTGLVNSRAGLDPQSLLVRALQEHSGTRYFLSAVDATIQWASSSAPAPLCVSSILKALAQPDANEAADHFGALVARAKTGNTAKMRWPEPEGTTVWEIQLLPLSTNHSVTHVFIVLQNVSADVHTERELQLREQQFRTLADTMPQIVWATRPDGYHDYFNQRWYSYTGMPRPHEPGGEYDPHGTGQGWNWRIYLHPEDFDRTNQCWQHSLETGDDYIIEYRFRGKDGQYRWFIGRAKALRDEDGCIARWFGTCTDIDDLKQTQQQMERLAALVAHSPDLVYLADVQGHICFANQTGTVVLGLSYAEALYGRHLATLLPPCDPDELLEKVKRYGTESGETLLRSFDGHTEFAVHYELFVVKASDGSLINIGLRMRDISQERRLEGERDAILESERQARAQAEHIMHLRDEFLMTVSHELRTPLNSILGWAQLLRRSPTQEMIERGVAVIQRNAEMQTQLVNDLLDMSRALSGKLRFMLAPIDLRTPVLDAVATVQPSAATKQIHLDIEVGDGFHVRGDAARLQQVVWNLLSNALKFTPTGGRIRVELSRKEGHVELVVEDTGPGIAAEFLPRLFDRFSQSDAAKTRLHGGLGLGLSIVRSIVEGHGGHIAACNVDGAGARFTVTLPELANGATNEESGLGLHGRQILLVEDNGDTRELVSRVLTEYGADCHAVGNAEDALALYEDRDFDAIVSDIGLPGANGYEFIRTIRHSSKDQNSRTPAVAVSALGLPADRERAMLAGFEAYLAKPVDPLVLVETLAKLMREQTDGNVAEAHAPSSSS